jgi:hypothetical protein
VTLTTLSVLNVTRAWAADSDVTFATLSVLNVTRAST